MILKKTFSRLDLKTNTVGTVEYKLFTLINKTFTPVKTTIEYLPKKAKKGTYETRTPIKHFDTQEVIDKLSSMILNRGNRQQKYVDVWQTYLDMIKAI